MKLFKRGINYSVKRQKKEFVLNQKLIQYKVYFNNN